MNREELVKQLEDQAEHSIEEERKADSVRLRNYYCGRHYGFWKALKYVEEHLEEDDEENEWPKEWGSIYKGDGGVVEIVNSIKLYEGTMYVTESIGDEDIESNLWLPIREYLNQ